MSDNRTAVTPDSIIESKPMVMGKDGGLYMRHDHVIECVKSYASDLREELENMKASNSAIQEAASLTGDEVYRLQQEVKRLTAIINEVQRYPETEEYYERYFLSSKGRELYKALSSKESKPS